MIALHGKDPILRKYHRLLEERPVLEVEYHTAIDISTPSDLDKFTRRNELALGRAQDKKTMRNGLDEAHRDRCCRTRAGPQQYGDENQEAERGQWPSIFREGIVSDDFSCFSFFSHPSSETNPDKPEAKGLTKTALA
jgi:hypothetical protein